MSETHAACHVTEMLQRCCGFLWILGACSWWIRALLCVWFRLIKQCAGMHNGTQLPMLPAGSACMQRSACTARQQREVWLWRVPVCSATLDCVPPACLAGAQHSNQARLHTVGEQAGGVCCTGMPLGLDITYTHQKIIFLFLLITCCTALLCGRLFRLHAMQSLSGLLPASQAVAEHPRPQLLLAAWQQQHRPH